MQLRLVATLAFEGASRVVRMRFLLRAATVVFALGVVGATLRGGEAAIDATSKGAADDALIARGAYLARLADCDACHSVTDKPAFAGGLALQSPIGEIYSTNITPDLDTGIGRWSLQDFDRALRRGVTPSHHLYPAMPYPSLAKVSDADIAALYAYFMRGVAPVRLQPPETHLPFPFNQRWGMALWNLVFLDTDVYRPDPAHDARWNRGAYLVQGLGHCGSCHTPRGLAYEERGIDDRSASYLTGGVNDHWFAPNLTNEPSTGLGQWSANDVTQFLESGHGGPGMVFGPMMQVVMDSTRHVDDADLASIATYLKSLPARQPKASFLPDLPRTTKTVAWLSNGDVHQPGDGLFMSYCAECHRSDGRGKEGDAPPLAGAAAVRSGDPSSVIHILLTGGQPKELPGKVPYEVMPAFGDKLDDRQIAELATFVRRSWTNEASAVDARTVRNEREAIAVER